MTPRRELTPTEAAERFIRKRENKNSEKTVRSYRNRLATFLAWAEDQEIETIDDLDGWLLDEYERHLEERGDAQITVKGKMVALSQLLQYCATIEVVDDDLPEKVDLPTPSKDEETSDELLAAEDARLLLEFFRNSTRQRGTAPHVTLELLWHVGGRISCFRALDLDDWDPDARVLKFRDRKHTPLKDGENHERNVLVSEPVAEAIDLWIARERPRKRDDHGRKPLLSTTHGRATDTTVRCWSYLATQPCLHKACPHNRERRSCEYTERSKSSQCPSSRSPHAIRTGSITWQLNCGIDYVKVAKRVAASPETIRRYYDKPDLEDELERRRPDTEDLDVLVDGE